MPSWASNPVWLRLKLVSDHRSCLSSPVPASQRDSLQSALQLWQAPVTVPVLPYCTLGIWQCQQPMGCSGAQSQYPGIPCKYVPCSSCSMQLCTQTLVRQSLTNCWFWRGPLRKKGLAFVLLSSSEWDSPGPLWAEKLLASLCLLAGSYPAAVSSAGAWALLLTSAVCYVSSVSLTAIFFSSISSLVVSVYPPLTLVPV